jgi:hypothetical protein
MDRWLPRNLGAAVGAPRHARLLICHRRVLLRMQSI